MPRRTASTPLIESTMRTRRMIDASDVAVLFEKRGLRIAPEEAQALADDANALASRPGEARTARMIATSLADVEALAIEAFSVHAGASPE